jgi:RNA polymerase sigma-70 factor (ECF subfamily)
MASAEDAPIGTRPDRAESSLELLRRARGGDRSALSRVFARVMPSLARWAHRRLPPWARDAMDTGDLVQEALANVVRRLPSFEPRHRKALRGYLREAIRNQIRDEIRRVRTRGPVEPISSFEPLAEASPHDEAAAGEERERYRRALASLSEEERELVVARLQLGYSYEQLAFATRKPSPDAARMAFKRALLKLANAMNGA